MGLIVEPFYFANEVDNLTGTPPAAGAVGTNFTAGANSVDGTAVSVLSALAFDVHLLRIELVATFLSTANSQTLVDILIDPAGGTSWTEFIDSLVCGFLRTINAGIYSPIVYNFPVYIKAGTSIGIRARTAHTSNITTPRVIISAKGNPNRPEQWWCGQKIESLGINAGSSAGTSITPGNSGAFGSWTDIGSVIAGRYGAIQLGLNGSDATAADQGYYWQIGYNSVKLPGSHTFFSTVGSTEIQALACFNNIINCDIPIGTQMQARGTCNGTAEVFNCAIYGVY